MDNRILPHFQDLQPEWDLVDCLLNAAMFFEEAATLAARSMEDNIELGGTDVIQATLMKGGRDPEQTVYLWGAVKMAFRVLDRQDVVQDILREHHGNREETK